MCNRCLSCCCCCRRTESPESNSWNRWLSGRFKKVEEISVPSTAAEIANVETITIEHQRTGAASIEKHQPRKSLSPNNATIASKESPRNSNFSDSTFGDISHIDVRLDIFEEDRFRDISEAIFKKHS